MRRADRVRDLELRAIRQAGGHDVLGRVARHVRRGPVDLGEVLAAERATAVRRHAAVAVDDDLAAGETGVGLGPPISKRRSGSRAAASSTKSTSGNSRSTGSITSAMTSGEERLDVDLLAVLRGDQDGVDARGRAVAVLDRHLALAVGPQVRDDARLADVRESPRQTVGHRDRERHQLLGLAAGEAEHHPLVAGAEEVELVAGTALTVLEVLDPAGDVR